MRSPVVTLSSNRRSSGDRRRVAFGDFQTPDALAAAVCRFLADERPAAIVEPTCGVGAFLASAIRTFPEAHRACGLDVNPRHVAAARRRVAEIASNVPCEFRVADFFQTDWTALFAGCAEPILIVGNPPWVTNSALGALGSGNHPRKENWHGRAGLEALTGKSNFDVSEWMIVHLLEAVGNRRATLAMLCKTAVAQKVLAHAWKGGLSIDAAEIRRIDAGAHFDANVDACLFVCRIGGGGGRGGANDCPVYRGIDDSRPAGVFGSRDGRLVADVAAYERVRHLVGGGFRWRSGVKHDCAAVFELRREGRSLVNGLGEPVDVERRYVYPLLKSSTVASGNVSDPRQRILVPQQRVGEDTQDIALHAPKTWQYLCRHAARLDRRASSVYRKQPRFAVFGVGPYTFSPWKVAVSGFYKSLRFAPVGPVGNRPAVFDDTCYLLPCRSGAEARRRADALNGEVARDFFQAFVFPGAKRPLTAEILGLLDLNALMTAIAGNARG